MSNTWDNIKRYEGTAWELLTIRECKSLNPILSNKTYAFLFHVYCYWLRTHSLMSSKLYLDYSRNIRCLEWIGRVKAYLLFSVTFNSVEWGNYKPLKVLQMQERWINLNMYFILFYYFYLLFVSLTLHVIVWKLRTLRSGTLCTHWLASLTSWLKSSNPRVRPPATAVSCHSGLKSR